jgi:hypothetical protein
MDVPFSGYFASNFAGAAYTVDRLTARIEHLGYRVHLEPVATSVA